MSFLSRSFFYFTLGTALAVPLPALAVFKCVDEKGFTHYGDTVPPQCAKREVIEYSSGGDVVQRINAPLSVEQARTRDEARAKSNEDQRKVGEQRARDLALIGTYGAEREFDVSRDAIIIELTARKTTLSIRVAEVEKLLQKYNDELEFYQAGKGKNAKAKEPPPQLTQDVARAKADIVNLNRAMERLDDDKDAVTNRFDGEKARWKRLKAGMPPGTVLDKQGNVAIEPEAPKKTISTIKPKER